MRRFWAACLVTTLALSACASGEDPATTASTAPTSLPSPTDEQSLRFLMALGRVDPRLGGNPDAALSAAQDVCADIKAGVDDAAIAAAAAERFSAEGVALSPQQGTQIADAVREAYCEG